MAEWRVALKSPVRLPEGGEIGELVFRSPKVGDLKGIKIVIGGDGIALDAGDLILLAARLANVPAHVIEGLGIDDFAAVSQALGPLSNAFPATGNA